MFFLFFWRTVQKSMLFFKNLLQTYIDGWETYIGTLSFENQCLKRHWELQGSHRSANGARILFFVFWDSGFSEVQLCRIFSFKSKVARKCEIPESRSKKKWLNIDGFSMFCKKKIFGHILQWFFSSIIINWGLLGGFRLLRSANRRPARCSWAE